MSYENRSTDFANLRNSRCWEPTRNKYCKPRMYTTIPERVEAMHLYSNGTDIIGKAIADWCGGEFKSSSAPYWVSTVQVPHVTGNFTLHEGDWLLKDVEGRFYSVPNEEFISKFRPMGGIR